MDEDFVGAVFPKKERLKIINQRLIDAAPASTADEAFELLRKTFDNVEDQLSSAAKVENPGLKYQGRMYAPREDYTVKLPNGGLEATTAGNIVKISKNGGIEFFLKNADRTTGKRVFIKLGKQNDR